MKFKFTPEGDAEWDKFGELETIQPMALSDLPCSQVAEVVADGPQKMLKLRPSGYSSFIVLPVITSGSRGKAGAWTWNGDLEKPTLRPSIRTDHGDGRISHLWLINGVCKYLVDSTCGNAGKQLPLLPLKNAVAQPSASARPH